MRTETNLHGGVLGEDHIHPTRHKMRVDRPSRTIERKSGADRTGMSQQAGDGAHESQTCSTPYGCSAIVRAVADSASMDSLSFVEIQRSGRQENVDCRHDVVRLGRYRMGAAFGVELQVTR